MKNQKNGKQGVVPMKATDLLKADHDRVAGLFARFKENENGDHKTLFKQIKGELDTHTHIEETIFYPAALKRGDKELKKIVREGLEEHGQVKKLLSSLSKMTARNKQFNPKLKVIIEDVEHHVEEEEDEMFPMCEDQFTDVQLEKLGAEMQAEKQRFMKRNRITPAPENKGMIEKAIDATKEFVGDLLTGGSAAGTSRSKSAKASTKATSNGKDNGKTKASSRSKKTATSKTAKSRPRGSSAAKGSSGRSRTAAK